MTRGTKSLLFGIHAFWLHPFLVALAWIRLYGWPRDFRIWVAFFVHDLGYFGKKAMDNPEGETHPEFGAKLMHRWFDKGPDHKCPICDGFVRYISGDSIGSYSGTCGRCYHQSNYWWDFTLYHSRYYARRNNQPVSRLCYADKLAVMFYPDWLYVLLGWFSGEIFEYMETSESKSRNPYDWIKAYKEWAWKWAIAQEGTIDERTAITS